MTDNGNGQVALKSIDVMTRRSLFQQFYTTDFETFGLVQQQQDVEQQQQQQQQFTAMNYLG